MLEIRKFSTPFFMALYINKVKKARKRDNYRLEKEMNTNKNGSGITAKSHFCAGSKTIVYSSTIIVKAILLINNSIRENSYITFMQAITANSARRIAKPTFFTTSVILKMQSIILLVLLLILELALSCIVRLRLQRQQNFYSQRRKYSLLGVEIVLKPSKNNENEHLSNRAHPLLDDFTLYFFHQDL